MNSGRTSPPDGRPCNAPPARGVLVFEDAPASEKEVGHEQSDT